jgi:DNA-binding SARP family transcriptional activator/TolB-like protein/Tfp pilus assembly protein PilF
MNVAERVGRSATGAVGIVRCLGHFRLEDAGGNQLQFRTRKARAILAVLALHGRPMSRDALADLLWSDRGETQARASLRQTIFELQHLRSCGYSLLAPARDDVSVARDVLVTDLELIRRAAANGDWPRLLTLLESSDCGLLADLDGLDEELDDWLRGQRAHEPAKTLGAAVEGAERCLAEAGPRAALELAGEILRLDPANEEATRLAMVAAHQAGDSVALHRHFGALRGRLREDYQAEPSDETLELLAKLGNGHAAKSAQPAAALAEPIPPPDPVPSEPRAPRFRVAAMAAIAVMLLVAAVAAFFLWRDAGQATAGAGEVVVAVLPFEQQPPDDSFLAAGLREQTRAALTRNPSIRVLGPATIDAVAAAKLTPRDYLRRFGVTHLLTGVVRRSGSQLLISVSLTRTSDGVAVWQDSFRGRMGAPFALQDAIASGIEGRLRAQLAAGGGHRAEQIATSPEVYALYSEARQLVAARLFPGPERAEALLRQAIRTDPNYAPAWALLGEAIYFNSQGAIVDGSRRKEALAAVQHALSLAPQLASAHATYALVQGEQSAESEAQLRRAVTLDPSYSEAWNWLGNSLLGQSRLKEAKAAYERAIAIDPLLSPAIGNLSAVDIQLGDEAGLDRLIETITRAGASPQSVASLRVEQAYASGDFSRSIELLRTFPFEGGGRPNPALWDGWFETLTALGYSDKLHGITGCPDWYAPLISGKTLPPTTFDNKPVTAEEFWTSMFFSAPASRAMVRLGHSRDLVALYRAGFSDADDFISRTSRYGMLGELAPNLAIALQQTGSRTEASYRLSATAMRLDEVSKRTPSAETTGYLAMIRAAQGDSARALPLLDLAVRRGWFPDGRAAALDLAQEPAFQSLRGDPRFEALRKRLLDHIARERAELGPLKA